MSSGVFAHWLFIIFVLEEFLIITSGCWSYYVRGGRVGCMDILSLYRSGFPCWCPCWHASTGWMSFPSRLSIVLILGPFLVSLRCFNYHVRGGKAGCMDMSSLYWNGFPCWCGCWLACCYWMSRFYVSTDLISERSYLYFGCFWFSCSWREGGV